MFRLFHYLNPFVFVFGFCFGLLMNIYRKPDIRCVYRYSTPRESVTYKTRDANQDECYQYHFTPVACKGPSVKLQPEKNVD
jgi:hypothetical protein